MHTRIIALVVLWLARSAGEVLIWIIRIVMGLTVGIVGLGLWGLSICVEALQKRRETSLSK